MLSRNRLLLAALCTLVTGPGAGAQTVLDRTPNLSGGWVGASGVLHFNFLHRFSISSAPERKVTSTPSFLLGAGLPGRTLLGVDYATNSELSPRYPNEWEFFGRVAPFTQELGAPIDVSAQVGYNLAAEGFDGEATIARRQGPVRVLAALRLLADPGPNGGADVALASGAVIRLTRYLAVSADLATLTKRASGERVVWGAGLNLAIPRTPHTLSLHATNVNNATLQSSSRGTNETRYGFEFTIPVTLRRYFGGRVPPRTEPGTPTPQAVEKPTPDAPAGGRDTVTAAVQDFLFRPGRLEIAAGTTIMWTNDGQVIHTVSAADGGFDSGPIEPGQRRSITFTRPGTFPFHCTPHPFMTGVIVVR
jgi:plastocyanin